MPKKLFKKIINKKARVGIVGVGYVGAALARAACEKKYNVLGFTRSARKIAKLRSLIGGEFSATSDFSRLSGCDVIVICVPTPVYEDKTPDLAPLKTALKKVAAYMGSEQLIIIESSVAVGTTRQIALPILEAKNRKVGVDFFLAFSPERVDPGNTSFSFKNIPKVVAGLDEISQNLATEFYKNIVERVVPVSSLETAEMVKLLENTFRLVNISFIHELVDYTSALGIDIREVISAAATKPFGFLPHYPGPGVGGHCIPVDPYYLLDDARKRNITLSLVEAAGRINDWQTEKVIKRALKILKETNGEKKTHKVLLIGLAYKPNVSDARESAGVKILERLQSLGLSVSYHDPHIPRLNGFFSKRLSAQTVKNHDLLIIATDHSIIRFEQLLRFGKPILDTRNVFQGTRLPNVFRIDL